MPAYLQESSLGSAEGVFVARDHFCPCYERMFADVLSILLASGDPVLQLDIRDFGPPGSAFIAEIARAAKRALDLGFLLVILTEEEWAPLLRAAGVDSYCEVRVGEGCAEPG